METGKSVPRRKDVARSRQETDPAVAKAEQVLGGCSNSATVIAPDNACNDSLNLPVYQYYGEIHSHEFRHDGRLRLRLQGQQESIDSTLAE